MITLNGVHGNYELEHDKNDNVVALKCKLAARNNINAVDMTFKDENNMSLDNNQYIPDGMRSLRYSMLDTSSDDIILEVRENQIGVPKFIQVNPEQSIKELIIIMKNAAHEHRELAVFNYYGERLINDMIIKDRNLRNKPVIKICAESDVELSLSVLNLTNPDRVSIPITFRINDSIEGVKNKIRYDLPVNNDLTLFTEKDYLEPGRRLIDYMVKKDDVIFYAELQRHDHIEIGKGFKKGQIATIFKGRIIDTNRDIILKRYNFNDFLPFLDGKEHIKFLKYDITTLARIDIDNHPRFVHMETMFEIDKYFYIGLELMNQSLNNCLPVTKEDHILRYATQTLEGLSYLHEMKIIYRSLKCSSILLDGNWNVKLSNFHFSKYLVGGNEQSRLYNATHSKPIDKNWAAPEMLEGNAYGLQADIWLYGATLIEMITKHPPYHDQNQSMVERNLCRKIKPVYEVPVECPRWVGTIIERCLQWEPLSRPKVDELIELINSRPR